jgi:hypothetical protein
MIYVSSKIYGFERNLSYEQALKAVAEGETQGAPRWIKEGFKIPEDRSREAEGQRRVAEWYEENKERIAEYRRTGRW